MGKRIWENFIQIEGTPKFREEADGAVVVLDCKLNSNHSLNGTLYPDPVLKEATSLYEGAKVFDNHSDSPNGWSWGPRQRGSVMGRVINARFPEGGGGHRGDFRVLPSWVKKGLIEDIKADAKAFGFSHVVMVEVADKPTDTGQEVVTKITEVESVDLVATPATTRGMFEGKRNRDVPGDGKTENKHKELDMDPKDETIALQKKQIETHEKTISGLNAQVAGLNAETAGIKSAAEATKKTLEETQGRLIVIEASAKAARVESALKELPESVRADVAEAIKPLPVEAALKVIESTKKACAGVAGQPRSEGAARSDAPGTNPAATGKSETVTDDAFLLALNG